MVHPHHARDSRADGVAARRLGPRGLFAPRWGRTPGAGEDDRAAGRTTRALPWAVALLRVGPVAGGGRSPVRRVGRGVSGQGAALLRSETDQYWMLLTCDDHRG